MLKRKMPLWMLVLAVVGVSGVVGSMIVERMLTGSVTINAYGDIGLLNGDTGLLEELTNLDFGSIDFGAEANRSVVVENTGNADLYLTLNIIIPTEIGLSTKHVNGTYFKMANPKLLVPGQQVTVVITVWSKADDAYGTYDLTFNFIGEA